MAENQAAYTATPYDSASERPAPALPDGRKMTFGERFQHALRTLPVKQREQALGRTDKMLRTYTDDRVALDVVMALARTSMIPAAWIIFGESSSSVSLADYAMVPGL